VGLGLVIPRVFYSCALPGRMKLVKAKDFSPKHNVWSLHARHIGRLAPAVRCVRDAVKQLLHMRGSTNSRRERTSSSSSFSACCLLKKLRKELLTRAS
jgi:hypothetical protein